MLWKNKQVDKKQDCKIILGMIMLQDESAFNVDNFSEDFKFHYGGNIEKPTGNSTSFVFTVGRAMVAVGHVSAPIPLSDIEETAQYAYNWPTALEETKEHKSHLIVSIIQGGHNQIKRFNIFTQVLCSLLRTTNSIGVYKGSQSLLIPTDKYLSEAELMAEDYLPLNLWLYFGLRTIGNRNSAYTYGLKQFNKTELEVLNSYKNLELIRGFLFDIAHYVLYNDVTFQGGQTVGGSEEEKVFISLSKGQFVEGDTFKLAY